VTTWISHRGYCEHATENTAEAFRAAIEFGFTHLETDLRCTRDGHIVLSHDPDLRRVSGRFNPVHELSRAELAKERLLHGESLLFFDEFLEQFAHLDWILDLKPENAAQTIHKLYQMSQDPAIKEFLEQRVRFLCWSPQHEDILAARLMKAKFIARDKACYRAGTAALIGLPQIGKIKKYQTYAVPPSVKGIPVLFKHVVNKFHDQGARVIGYLPTTLAEHQRALNAGVDEMLTNYAPLRVELTKD